MALRNLDFTQKAPTKSVIAEIDEFSRTFRTMREHVKDHNDAVARFVPTEFLEELGSRDITTLRLGDHREEVMTLLFSDIRSFTTLSGTMTPAQTFNFVNSYYSQIGPVGREHGGFIDKYIGDAIFAIFPHVSNSAVEAAIAMQRKVQEYN